MKTIILTLSLLLLVSCGSEDAQFFPIAGDIQATPNPVPITPIDEAPEDLDIIEDEIVYDCSGELEEIEMNVFIPESNKTCEWNTGDNLTRKNSYTRARKETPIGFTLPDSATICSLEITSEKELFKYDDHLYLTLNNSVIFSSYPDHITELMVPGTDIPQFNWEKLVNLKFNNNDLDRFCLGSELGSSCEVPQTQKVGEMKIKIVDEVVQEVFALSSSKESSSHILNLIISGDDNSSDCKHSAMDIKVKMKVPKVPESL